MSRLITRLMMNMTEPCDQERTWGIKWKHDHLEHQNNIRGQGIMSGIDVQILVFRINNLIDVSGVIVQRLNHKATAGLMRGPERESGMH